MLDLLFLSQCECLVEKERRRVHRRETILEELEDQ